MPKVEFFVPVRPVQLAEWQVQHHKDVRTRSELRRSVFLRVQDDKDTSSLEQNFIDNNHLYHGRGSDIFRKEVRIATFAERGFKVVFGKGDNPDRIVEHTALSELITLEEKRIEEQTKVIASQANLRTRI